MLKSLDSSFLLSATMVKMLEELLLFLVEAAWCVAVPAVHSLKCLKQGNSELFAQWSLYWIIYAFLCAAGCVLEWLPGYVYLRILVLAYLAFPPLKGPQVVWKQVEAQAVDRVKPFVSSVFQQFTPK